MENSLSRWSPIHLRALANAEIAGLTSEMAAALHATGDPDISEDIVKDYSARSSKLIHETEEMLKGQNLGIILEIKDKDKILRVKSSFDTYEQDYEKLQANSKELLRWYPINFASFSEYRVYMDNEMVGLAKQFVKQSDVRA